MLSTANADMQEEEKLPDVPFHQHQCTDNGLLLHLKQPLNIGGTMQCVPNSPP